MQHHARGVCNPVAMRTPRRSLAAVALLLSLTAACTPATTERVAATAPLDVVTTSTAREFTDDEVRYLAAQAWTAAETSAFLQHVAAIRAAVPAELHRIMWCEAGSYLGLPYPQTNYQAMTHGYEGASGGGQALGSTWRTWAREIGVDVARWPVAFVAPDWVQDLVLTHGYRTRGTSPWTASSSCWT